MRYSLNQTLNFGMMHAPNLSKKEEIPLKMAVLTKKIWKLHICKIDCNSFKFSYLFMMLVHMTALSNYYLLVMDSIQVWRGVKVRGWDSHIFNEFLCVPRFSTLCWLSILLHQRIFHTISIIISARVPTTNAVLIHPGYSLLDNVHDAKGLSHIFAIMSRSKIFCISNMTPNLRSFCFQYCFTKESFTRSRLS